MADRPNTLDVEVKDETKTSKKDEVNFLNEGGLRGLAVILAAFMIQVFSLGTATSIGIYNVEFLEYFDNDISGVALLTSLNIAFFMGAGPLANLLSKKFSHRSVVLVGAGLSVVGIFAMPWMDNLHGMIVTYGFLAGLGFCFSYVPSHVMSGLYYNKYRSLSTGLATSGSGLGAAVFPPFVSYLIDMYSWKGSLIIIAGLNLHVFIFGMLLRPLPAQPKPNVEQEPGDVSPEPKSPMTKKHFLKAHLWLFCNFGFDMYFVSNFLWNCAAAIFIAFAPDFFNMQGLDKMDAAFVMTLFGLGTFVGGIIGGILGNIERFNRLYIYIAVNVISGAMVFLFPVIGGYESYGTLSFFFGICFGVILGLLIIVLTDLLGPEHLGDGFGYIMVAGGIGVFAGPPIAGLFKDVFGGYEEALNFAGIALFVAGFIMCFIPLQKRLCGDSSEGSEKSGRMRTHYPMSEITIAEANGETQGNYRPVESTSGSPEHRIVGKPFDVLKGEERAKTDTDHEHIQVMLSEEKGFENATFNCE